MLLVNMSVNKAAPLAARLMIPVFIAKYGMSMLCYIKSSTRFKEQTSNYKLRPKHVFT